MIIETPEYIKDLSDRFEQCVTEMAQTSSDETLNKFIVLIDQIRIEKPMFYNQLMGQVIVRNVIESMDNEFDARSAQEVAA